MPFEIDDWIDPGLITAHAGVPLVIELFRRVGAAQVVTEQVRLKQRQRGLTPAQLVETLIAFALGPEQNLGAPPRLVGEIGERNLAIEVHHINRERERTT